jgi:hypothetical protein
MPMVRELIAAVMAAEKNIDDQITKLRSYSKQNDDIMHQIALELGGSTHSSAFNMKQQLSQTQTQIKATVTLLETAKTKLQRVRQI